MPTPPIPEETIAARAAAYRAAVAAGYPAMGESVKAGQKSALAVAGAQCGVDVNQIRRAVARTGGGFVPKPQFSAPVLPDEVRPIEELIEHRERTFARRQSATDARKLIPIRINKKGPIGIAIFGDLHIDDDGCNFPLLRRHTELVRETDGMFAACVGDLQNGWVGRLARKWAEQSTSAKEAWALVEWWIKELRHKLLFVTEGNHDAWAVGVNGISLVQWICAQQGTVSDSSGVRVELQLPCGKSYTINCRHDFRGRSQYNHAHGMTKAALFGWRDDVLIAGHTHVTGYNPVKDPMTGAVNHPVRVASYKHIDEYAKTEGFPDQNITECVVVMIDPEETDERHRVWIEFNPFRAARYLKAMRGKP